MNFKNASTAGAGTSDALVVGRFAGQEEFAAIGVAGTVMNLFLLALVDCCSGKGISVRKKSGTTLHRTTYV